MSSFVRQIPNFITLSNLFCGGLALIYAAQYNFILAFFFVVLAAFLDFFDGFIARLLKVDGSLGKQLDSLADCVTFGIVPSLVLFYFIRFINYQEQLVNIGANTTENIHKIKELEYFFPWWTLLIAVFSCYRLAKFNLDTRQTDQFIGLPTPANALFFCSIPVVFVYELAKVRAGLPQYSKNVWTEFFACLDKKDLFFKIYLNKLPFYFNNWFLLALVVLFSYLLIAELPLFALKFKSFNVKENAVRYLFLLSALVLLITLSVYAIPLIIVLYIFVSVIVNATQHEKF